jgi:hypothetical protein
MSGSSPFSGLLRWPPGKGGNPCPWLYNVSCSFIHNWWGVQVRDDRSDVEWNRNKKESGTSFHLCGLSRCLHAGCHRSWRTDKCVWSINLRYGSSMSISRSRQCWLVRWVLVGHQSNRETERIRSSWHITKRWQWMTIASHGVIKLACRPKFAKTMLCVVSTRLRTLQN